MANPFGKPREFSFRSVDLRVALAVKGAEFDFAWADPELGELGYRLRVDEVKAGINDDYPRAELSLNMAGEYVDNGVEMLKPVSMSSFNRLIHPDTLLIVYGELPDSQDGGGPGSRRFLFGGYPNVQSLRFSENATEIRFTCTSLLERLSKEPLASIRGRYMRAPAGADPTYRLCPALPAIFNYRGKKNRHADLLADVNGVPYVPVFTYEGDPNAKHWKYADVITYLLAFYLKPLGEEYFLKDGNGVSFAADVVSNDADPEPAPDPSNMTLVEILRGKSDELACEAHDVVKALLLMCRSAGMGLMQWAFNDGAGKPLAKLLFWSLAEGGPWQDAGLENERTLREKNADALLAPDVMLMREEGADSSGLTAEQALSGATTGDLTSDSSSVIASCSVDSSVDEYEVGCGYQCSTKATDILKPLWAPDGTFGDNANAGTLASKLSEIETVSAEATGTPLTMFQRYVRSGSDHLQYRYVGRLFGLNEAGEYDGATYGRTNNGVTAWDAAAYNTAFNFHDNCDCPRIAAAEEGQADLDWLARRRKFFRPLSRYGSKKEEIRPIVHASWDSGVHWYEYPGAVSIQEDQCAVLLTDNNLASVKCPGAQGTDPAAGYSVWEAIVRGTFRVAITATIEGDTRVSGAASSADAFTTFTPHRTVWAKDLFKRRTRTPSSRCVGNASYSFTDVDESAQAEALAKRFVGVAQARLTAGTLVRPWASLDWLPGDRIAGLGPRGVSFAATKSLQESAKRWPQIIETVWVNNDGNQVTRYTLDDRRRSLTQAVQSELS